MYLLWGKSHHFVVIIALAVATAAHAQTSEEEDLDLVYGDSATVSIATGNHKPLRHAPAVATVITASDIAAMGASGLNEVLDTVPGVHVSRAAKSFSPVYVIRGIYHPQNPQTLMLVNGIPMTTMYIGNKGNLWSGYPVENIARIEIIRGPGSALYGADAYAGVINIITKTGLDTPGTDLGLRVGSFNSRRSWVRHGGEIGPVTVAAFLSAGHADGSMQASTVDAHEHIDNHFGAPAPTAQSTTNMGNDAIDGNLDFGYEKWRLRFGYNLRDTFGTGLGMPMTLGPAGKERSERITSDLSWRDPQFSRNVGVGFGASYLQFLQRMQSFQHLDPSSGPLPPSSFTGPMVGAPETSERQIRLSAFARYTGFEGHRIRIGLGYDDLDMYDAHEMKDCYLIPLGVTVPSGPSISPTPSTPAIQPERRRINYVYAQDEWQLTTDWSLTAGLRHDRYSDFGSTTNPRLALVWDAAYDVTAKLLYGTAFRAPTLNEQISNSNPASQVNASLRPETIRTLEAAIAWQASRRLKVNLNVFHYQMEDLIRPVPKAAPAIGYSYFNAGRQTGRGEELEVVYDVSSDLRLSANFAHQRSFDAATGKDAGYAPQHELYARADWAIGQGLVLSPQINWVADRKRAAGDNRPAVPDYATVDLTLRTTSGFGQWDFAVTVRNLFNADAREPSLAPGQALPNDLPTAPQAVYFQAIYRM